jgi:hypothetical protein
MNLRKSLVSLLVALIGLGSTALAQTQTSEATVQRVTGTATVTLADGSTAALTQGMKVPQGATITTGADGDVYLESHAGYVSSIKADSVVTVEEISVTSENGQVKEEKTLLDLKSGNLVAKLDPKKKSVNNYQVRTPKGVAAARGTVFTVQYKGGNYTIAVVNGQVLVTPPSGSWSDGSTNRQSIEVSNGKAFTNWNNRSPITLNLASLNSSDAGINNSLRDVLALAVATVAVAAQNGIGGTTAAEAASVAQTIMAAVPAVAEQAGALMKQSGVSSGAVADAVRAVVPASAQGAFDSGVSTGTFTPSAATTTTTTPSAPATTPQPITPENVSRSG